MKNKKRHLSFIPCLLSLISFFLFAPPQIHAQEPKFAVSQEIIYEVHDNGNTSVTQNFTFTNLTSEFFPQEYLLKVGKLKINNLKAVDSIGLVPITADPLAGENAIRIRFNDQVAGQGKILRWTLNFDTPEIASKQGRLWDIMIPVQPKLEGVTALVVRLVVPTSFGKNVFNKPVPAGQDLFWNLTDNPSQPIELVFDPVGIAPYYQVYDFALRYHLYNSRLYPVAIEVALPRDTQSQKIFLSSLYPKPANVTSDQQGNWLARYELGPVAKLEVAASGSAALFLQPNFPSKNDPDLENYLRPDKFWPVNDAQVTPFLKKLSTPLSIYDFVTSLLDYQLPQEKYTRLGARSALLSSNKAGPYEYSDLFITLARASSLPAKEVNGYYLGSKTARHVWPEFYDSQKAQWQAMDPFLGDSSSGLDYFNTLDFRHVTFFVSPTAKTITMPDEAIFVAKNSNPDFDRVPLVTGTVNSPKQITAGFPSQGELYIENLGPGNFTGGSIAITSQNLEFDNKIYLTGEIPPFGHNNLIFKINPPPWVSQFSDIITFKFGFERQEYPVTVVPLYKNVYLLIFTGFVIIGIISIIAQIARGISVQKRTWRNNLRGQGQKSA